MPSQEEIDQQQELLATHRRTLAHYLRQQAQLGTAHEPPGVASGIAEARAGIARCKATLRNWGALVDDHPDDEPLAELHGAVTAAPHAVPRPIPPASTPELLD